MKKKYLESILYIKEHGGIECYNLNYFNEKCLGIRDFIISKMAFQKFRCGSLYKSFSIYFIIIFFLNYLGNILWQIHIVVFCIFFAFYRAAQLPNQITFTRQWNFSYHVLQHLTQELIAWHGVAFIKGSNVHCCQ